MSTTRKLPLYIDINRNGIEDYRESAFQRGALKFAIWLLTRFPSHTIAARAGAELQKLEPAINGFIGE